MTILDENYLNFSNVAAIFATGLLSLNLLLGMMISMKYRKFSIWQKYVKITRHINVLSIHNYTGFIGLGVVILHVSFVLLATSSGFTIWSVLYPVVAPHQPLFVSFGTLSLIALTIVLCTSLKISKRVLHYKVWKRIHFISYAGIFLFLIHGIMMDPTFHDNPIDLLDAEKLVSSMALLILLIVASVRIRLGLRHSKKVLPKVPKPNIFVTILIGFFMLVCSDIRSQILVTGSYQGTLNGSVLGSLLPSVGHRLLLSYTPSFGGSFDSRTEYYTEGSYNADVAGELITNINEQKFEFQLLYTRQLLSNISVTIGGLHHENFTFTDHYFWLFTGVTYSGFILDSTLRLSGGALVEKKVFMGRLFYDLSATVDVFPLKDLDIFANIHRYENVGMNDHTPTEKLEYEFGFNKEIAQNQLIGLSFFRHEQFGAPNDQFSFIKCKYLLMF